jgi:DNA polymerase (family X)
MSMDRRGVALVLEEIATLLEASGGNRFKARAFMKAARIVDKLDAEPADLVASGALRAVPGLGPATAGVIEELVVTGESAYHAELRTRAPSGLRDLLRVPGLGNAKVAQLYAELGIADLDSLEAAARAGRIAGVRGFGEPTQARILAGIPFARGATGRRRYHHALEAAARLASYFGRLPGVAAAHTAGELRRALEIVDSLVFVLEVPGDLDAALAAVRGTPGLIWAGDASSMARGRMADGVPVEVRLARSEALGVAALFATGSPAHVEAVRAAAARVGVTLADDGVFRDGVRIDVPDEAAVYRAVGMQYVPPELRETGDEVAVAQRDALPRLVELEELRGCFHCHTTFSDGTSSVAEMAEGAIALGWRYLGIADHSRSAGYAGGLSGGQLRRQRREIAAWNRRRGAELYLFAGVEADILPDGRLDYAAQGEAAVLDACDFVIGSVHSGFRMERSAMTQRVVAAVSDPRLTMLGHATGRLLLTREGYDLDVARVIDAAAAAGAVLEINADPHRLDLSWQHWPRARELDVCAAINPDAHSVAGMRNVRFGVGIARKAWLRADDVVNAWPFERVVEFLVERKERSGKAD